MCNSLKLTAHTFIMSLRLTAHTFIMSLRLTAHTFIMSWALAWKGKPRMWTKWSEGADPKSTASGGFSEVSLGSSEEEEKKKKTKNKKFPEL